MKYYAIIVGGGSGSRMQSDIPKQFLLLSGRPVLMHTIEAFQHSSLHPEIILVLNSAYHVYWKELCMKYHFTVPHQLVTGGEQRFYSVKNGLDKISDDAVIAVHDAVRPLISDALITKCFLQAKKKGNAVCGIPSKDSVRQLNESQSIALNRENIFLMQTPQTFRSEILKNAYTQTYSSEFTDDASVVEKAGYPIHIIEGEHSNIKITYPEDLEIAELLLNKKIRPTGC